MTAHVFDVLQRRIDRDFADRIALLTDEQVALLEDVPLERVPELRAAIERDKAERPTVYGLVLARRRRKQHEWTPGEDALLMSGEFTAREVAQIVGVTEVAAAGHRDWIKRGHKMSESNRRYQAETAQTAEHSTEEWSEEEDRLVMSFAGSAFDLARRLGRTYTAVTTRRYKLRKEAEEE